MRIRHSHYNKIIPQENTIFEFKDDFTILVVGFTLSHDISTSIHWEPSRHNTNMQHKVTENWFLHELHHVTRVAACEDSIKESNDSDMRNTAEDEEPQLVE